MTPEFAPDGTNAIPVDLVSGSSLAEWLARQDEFVRRFAAASAFSGKPGHVLIVPDEEGNIGRIVAGWQDDADGNADGFRVASILGALPAGDYRLANLLSPRLSEQSALASLFAQYGFDRYTAAERHGVRLVAPDGCDGFRLLAIARGEFLTRDLINTPASDLGPEELEREFGIVAAEFDASFVSRTGRELEEGFPLVHAVGAAAVQRPRLLDLRWGQSGPRLTLIGKGVCFDTGGLNIKPTAGMQLMKKDMGGAAAVAGLARMIMELDLPLRLRVLVPAVENAISGNAMRPGDVLVSRSGKSVEITNTDAEGRLVLADAIALADEESPDLLVTLATLTGAARVAVGPDVVPFYTDSNRLADELVASGNHVQDPLWRMPNWQPYLRMLHSDVADLANASRTAFAGSITAALFLRQFVGSAVRYVHFDMYGWKPEASPGYTRGGVGQVSRALLDALPRVLDL